MPQLNRPPLFTSNTSRPRTSEDVSLLRTQRPGAKRNVSFNPAAERIIEPELTLDQLADKRQGEELQQRIDRLAQNIDCNIEPATPSSEAPSVTPFAVFDDSMSILLGQNPSLKLEMNDIRAPYFYSGGAWVPNASTLFLTSNLIRDVDPTAAAAAGRRTEMTKIELYSSQDFSRDKVRFPDRRHLAAGCAPYPSPDKQGVVLCVQGTLGEPAGLLYVDAKRPHKSQMLLNNFQGRPFNSPCDIAANFYDNCLYFTDPAYGHERGYRQKPELPTGHIYRFDPSNGDCRVVVDRLQRPGGLAFSPDFAVLYVSDLSDRYGGTSIHAFDMMYTGHITSQPTPSIKTVRPETSNGHQKNLSASSTTSSVDSGSCVFRDPPTASSRALAAATTNHEMRKSPATAALGQTVGCLSRSSSRDRARRILDIANPSSRQLKSVSSSLGMNLKSSFHTTPALTPSSPRPQQLQHAQNYSYQSTRPPSPPLTTPSSALSNSYAQSAMGGEQVRRGAFVTNKRLFAYSTSFALSGGISTDPIQGNLWLGTEDGVEIFGSVMGSLVGKVLVSPDEDPSLTTMDGRKTERKMRGVGKVAFTDPGEAWLLGGERMWRMRYGSTGGTW